jgi:hypothetical protein
MVKTLRDAVWEAGIDAATKNCADRDFSLIQTIVELKMSDDDELDPGYLCAVCGQDLNHSCYNVFAHPLFPGSSLCPLL